MNNEGVSSSTEHQRFELHEGDQIDSTNLIIVVTAIETAGDGLPARVRLANHGKVPLKIIKVQSGSCLREDDIVRFEDTYGRK